MAPATLANKSKPKHKRVVLTMKQKTDICNKLDKGAHTSAKIRDYSIWVQYYLRCMQEKTQTFEIQGD